MKVFISCAREDLETARKLHADLQKSGFEPWLDECDLLAGQKWDTVIRKQLKQSDAVIRLLSKISVSKRGFGQVEEKRAAEILDEFPESGIFVIPVRLDDCDLPVRLEKRHRVDLFPSYQDGLGKILKALRSKETQKRDDIPKQHRIPGIYISYALIDNAPAIEGKNGWVTALKIRLETRLSQLIGSDDAFSMKADLDASSETDPVPDHILEFIEHSQTLIVVLSPGYLLSERCKRELRAFLEKNESRRIMVVERDPIPESRMPDSFKDIRPFRFWEKNREDARCRILGDPVIQPDKDGRYYDLTEDMIRKLADVIECVGPETVRPAECAEKSPEKMPAVFLAEVTEDLFSIRDNVKRHLDEKGFRVLPEKYLNFGEPDSFRRDVETELAKCKIFVQLLSGLAGKTRPDLPGKCRIQYETAVTSGKPIFQWQSADLNVESVSDDDQRNLLSVPTVMAASLTEFKERVIRAAGSKAPETAKTGATSIPLVFLNADKTDSDHLDKIKSVMKKHRVDHAWPNWDKKDSELLGDMEDFILGSDGVIVIYGVADSAWLRKQLLYCRNLIYRREKPIRAFAVYEGPPENKSCFNFEIVGINMIPINCRDCFDERRFAPFLDALMKGDPS